MTPVDIAMVALSLALGFFLGLVYAYDHWTLPLERIIRKLRDEQ